MKLMKEMPHFLAMCRDGSSWLLPLDLLDDFDAAWDAGKPFWKGRDGRGAQVKIKLADITGTIENNADVLVQIEAEREEEQGRKMLAGDGD